MSLTCEFCNKTYSNKYNLKKHQKTTKSCLFLQDKVFLQHDEDCKTILNCEYCFKKFFRSDNVYKHDKICKVKKKLKAQEEAYEKKLKAQEENHKKKLMEHKIEIKDLQDRLENLAKIAIEKPTTSTSTTTNNNVINLTPFNMEDSNIKDKIHEFYNLEYLRKGHQGVAEFTKDNLLLDDKGKLKYICCDPSRLIFKYRDENGELRKDVKANRLSLKITPGIINKAHSIVIDEVKKLDSTEAQANLEFYDLFFRLKELENKPEKLGNELSKIVT